MIFRQLFDSSSGTYTYLLACKRSREGVLIDPVYERHSRDAALIRELDIKLLFTLDTHCHADHVTGAWLMKQSQKSRVALSPAYGAENVDYPLTHGGPIAFGDETLEVRATPGHTVGCCSFVTSDASAVFTGDTLLVRGAGRTDFQLGDAAELFRSIHTELFALSDDCIVYPGHDYDGRSCSTIGEERRFNARIGGAAREEDFVGTMNNLALPPPKKLELSVPANMKCGKLDESTTESDDWSPSVSTYSGIREVPAEWVFEQGRAVQVIDVRTAEEYRGPLGHVDGSLLIPLDELRGRLNEIERHKPVVTVCQTGRRSGLATVILRGAGLPRVANLAGGMVKWKALGLATATT